MGDAIPRGRVMGTESLEGLRALSGRWRGGGCRDGGRFGARDSLPIGKLADSRVRRSQRAERLHRPISNIYHSMSPALAILRYTLCPFPRSSPTQYVPLCPFFSAQCHWL